ncbi:hypothetical protein [Mycobacteroides abscessus]|uniref:hypothetical protein n=1 Tax=Mycobacteroides abscessus TaxID=36809 RepID=UPI001F32F140|nr:hypothetical protein [Mycobacteroides abscessus]
MMITQSQPGATVLIGLALALGVSVVGCSAHPTTPSGSSATGEPSNSVSAQVLVDVSAVWASHPLPPCPDTLIGNAIAPAGLTLPSDESVAKELVGVRSPASEGWVRTKLGWVTKALGETRAGIIASAGTAGARAQGNDFELYVSHVRDELQLGRDTASDLDSTFIERCLP